MKASAALLATTRDPGAACRPLRSRSVEPVVGDDPPLRYHQRLPAESQAEAVPRLRCERSDDRVRRYPTCPREGGNRALMPVHYPFLGSARRPSVRLPAWQWPTIPRPEFGLLVSYRTPLTREPPYLPGTVAPLVNGIPCQRRLLSSLSHTPAESGGSCRRSRASATNPA
jgi:hypothetical protein